MGGAARGSAFLHWSLYVRHFPAAALAWVEGGGAANLQEIKSLFLLFLPRRHHASIFKGSVSGGQQLRTSIHLVRLLMLSSEVVELAPIKPALELPRLPRYRWTTNEADDEEDRGP